MIIIYRTSFVSYLIMKHLITLDKIGMVNILLDEKMVPELIQSDVNEGKIFSESEKILSDKNLYEEHKEKLNGIKEKLKLLLVISRRSMKHYKESSKFFKMILI